VTRCKVNYGWCRCWQRYDDGRIPPNEVIRGYSSPAADFPCVVILSRHKEDDKARPGTRGDGPDVRRSPQGQPVLARSQSHVQMGSQIFPAPKAPPALQPRQTLRHPYSPHQNRDKAGRPLDASLPSINIILGFRLSRRTRTRTRTRYLESFMSTLISISFRICHCSAYVAFIHRQIMKRNRVSHPWNRIASKMISNSIESSLP
jgi:hypothetical protein